MKTRIPADLMRANIVHMTPYTPIKPFEVLSEELGIPVEQIVKLDANENPYGPAPEALRALTRLEAQVPIYPDPGSTALRAALAPHLGVDAAQVVVGSGADELIELLFKLFVAPGDPIINCPPTFGMYTFCASIAEADEIVIERRADYSLDVDAIENAARTHRPKLILLCAPNNPDGGTLPTADLERLLALDSIIVLDEAYVAFAAHDLNGEFGPHNNARRVTPHPNLVVLRTFSKWAGLAGLRCGYGILSPAIVRYMMTIKQPYNLNVAAGAAALASLDALPLLRDRVNAILDERARLYAALQALPRLRPHPSSQANFVLVEVTAGSAADLKARLAARGILVRYFAKPRLKNHIRISVGTPEQTDKLIAALEDIL